MVRLRARALPVMVALLVLTAGWLYWDGSSRRDARAAGLEAMQAARESVVAVFSYRAETVEKDLDTARERLTGRFLDDYTQLVKTVVVPDAKQRRISAAAKVAAAAVVSAEPDNAVVLAYVDQTTTEGADNPTVARSTVRVTMEKVDGRWLISGFQPI